MPHILPSPGRSTRTHLQFFDQYPDISAMRIVGIDVGTANFMYASGSPDLVLCASERYWLELHKLLLLAPAHRYIRECWEEKFDSGQDWIRRCKVLSAYNNLRRGKILNNWDDVATLYCLMAMSGFSYTYKKWQLIGEHAPIEPDYEGIRYWANSNKGREVKFYRSNIYNFPIGKLDDNSLLYLHLPDHFAHYGCGYSWTRRKLEFISKELNSLAAEGYKICVSALHTRWGRVVNNYSEYFDPQHFVPVLKACEDTDLTEVYLVANL